MPYSPQQMADPPQQEIAMQEHAIATLRRRNRELRSAVSTMNALLSDITSRIDAAERCRAAHLEELGAAHDDHRRQVEARLAELEQAEGQYQRRLRKLRKLRRHPIRFVRDSKIARRLADLTRRRP